MIRALVLLGVMIILLYAQSSPSGVLSANFSVEATFDSTTRISVWTRHSGQADGLWVSNCRKRSLGQVKLAPSSDSFEVQALTCLQ
jgi:hypothetical protein